ncbi:MAG TPA: molecular chaperone HtpG [Pyrinomonadaceae bacterium]|jgi:molecular chaperone HtpG
MVSQIETHDFQAETKQLLDLMIHSLYTTKEIFLRELISNASDALDRLRFEALTTPELMSDAPELEIRLASDRKARTLTISDTGIGMSGDEIIANIGTIAKSGTRELREKLREGVSNEKITELIGQFGVGFYSSFMVADKVTLVTRRAGETTATQWESTGNGQYTLSPASKPDRGTSITLHLKPFNPEEGIEDYTDKWILSRIVKRYSDFISYPIIFSEAREEAESEGEEKRSEDTEAAVVVEDKILNSMKPIWTRAPADVTESEYAEFYKHISHDTNEPLRHILAKAEGVLEYRALVFIPSHAPRDLYYHAAEAGLRLYAKGVLIMEQCADLLPRYLRFIKGVVDSSDLPLNISRQMLQQDRQITQIRRWLTKKLLDALQNMFESDYEKYLKFWEQFGRAFKEGVSSDFENKDKIVSLLLFESSADAEKLTTLKDYVGRMKDEQQEIFYLTGESRKTVENSPHLEAFREKGYEVLYLIDPVDELVVQSLMDYEGKKLKSVGKGTVRLGNEEERAQAESELKEKQEQSAELLSMFQKHLDEHIKEVRLTNRLTVSPVCLVGSELDYSPQMERLLMMGKGAGAKQRRIMELNPQHAIFTKIRERYQENQHDENLTKYAELLLGYALLAEGSELPDPVRFNSLLAELMTNTL